MKTFVTLTTIATFALTAAPALASDRHHDDNPPAPVTTTTIVVTNSNFAMVSNNVDTSAKTGGNTANGGEAENIVISSAVGTNGGNAATGVNGGSISTGEASAVTGLENDVNFSDIGVSATCGTCNQNTVITVAGDNGAFLANGVETSAKTGGNDVSGGELTNVVKNSAVLTPVTTSRHHDDPPNPTPVVVSNGGNAATGANGGSISTGAAGSMTSILNVINSSLIRVIR
jgi:hypothetical protein